MNTLGIDLGGTKISLVKYDSDSWNKRTETTVSTKSKQGVKAVIQQLIELISEYSDPETNAIGIGVPGPTINGIVERFPNIPGLENFDLIQSLKSKLPSPYSQLHTVIENDANCFTIGAWHLEKLLDKQNIIGLTLGTGVGGAIISDGNLIRGHDGAAGEFGHQVIRDGQTLEELVSGTALQRRWQEEHGETKTGAKILELADKKDQKALKFLSKIGVDLGLALANLILDFNPEIIILGGSASAPFPYYETEIRKMIKEKCFPQAEQTPIIVSNIPDCATFGAAWLASLNLSK